MSEPSSDHDWLSITVGQPFYRPIETGCQFNYAPPNDGPESPSAPHCELILSFESPTEGEREGFLKGVFEAVLVDLEGIPFVCVRFAQTVVHAGTLAHREAIGWQECPVHPVAADGYVPQAPQPPERWLLCLALVDSQTQRVEGVRVVSLSSEFCARFSETMAACRDDYSSLATYAAKLQDMYERYPVGAVVVKGQVLMHCLGGD